MGFRRSAWPAGLALTLLIAAWSTAPDRVQAQPDNLTWSAPSDCPRIDQVRDELKQIDPRLLDAALGAVTGEVTAHDGEFLLKLQVERSASVIASRELAATNCRELTTAATWLVALALEPLLSARAAPASEPRVTAAPEEPSATVVERPIMDLPSHAPTPPGRGFAGRIRLGLSGGASSLGLLGPHASSSAYLGLGVRRWYTQARVAHLFARRRDVDDEGRLSFVGQTMSLDQCSEWGRALRVLPCLGARLTRIHASVVERDHQHSSTIYWLSGLATLQAAAPVVGPLELNAALTLQIPMTTRPRFTHEASGVVGTVAVIGWELTLGVGVRL